jgi:outer membrane protein assembly factor BamD
MRRYCSLALIALFVVAVAGCSGSGQVRHTTAEEAFKKGEQLYQQEEYSDAIRYFRAVFSYGRATEWSDDAQLMMARAYYEDRQYRLAATEYRRFIQLYRNDERVPTAEFERAMSYYQLSPRYQLDQSDTEQALSLFQLFLDRYPQHERAPEAEEHIKELREKLAHKKIAAAELYERRGMYRAAALTYETAFDQYPETSWADNALLGAVRTFIEYSNRSVEQRQAERLQKALDHYNRLTQLFPNSPLLDQAEALYEQAQRRMEEIRERESLADSANNG